MDERLVFKWLFLVLFISVLFIRAIFGIKQRRMGQSSWSINEEAVEREGRWSLLLRPIGFIFFLGLVVLYMIEPSGSDWLFLPLPSWVRWTGVLLCTASILLLVWVHRTLGIHWSTTLQFKEGHTLVTSGPYKFVRHPMYSALIFFFIGISIVSSFWPFIALVLILILFFFRIIEREEAMMIEQFGDEYQAYMKRTGRCLPGLRSDLG
ncbi:MAG TPA: isoprenylcysteine carboxylmethyltransferase family protein [Anaerolineae bacterium]|nr:isoprenylcysteine carboxylmethyltransferase family protein [Anaerolineae bacterium]